MDYQTYKPAQHLQPFIDKYYILQHDSSNCGPKEFSTAVHCTASLVFNLKDPASHSPEASDRGTLPSQFIAGPAMQSSPLLLWGQHLTVGIVLRGPSMLRFFNVNPRDVLNSRISLDFLPRSQTERLRQQLLEVNNHAGMVHVLNTFFLQHLKDQSDQIDRIDYAAGLIMKNKGRLRMDDLSSTFNMSPRNFRRQFKAMTGLGPKLFSRIKRIGYTRILLSRQLDLTWQDIIQKTGFYDQAHLIKELSKFAHRRPSDILKELGKQRHEA